MSICMYDFADFWNIYELFVKISDKGFCNQTGRN